MFPSRFIFKKAADISIGCARSTIVKQKGNKPKLPMVQWSSVNFIGGHVRKLDCSVYRFFLIKQVNNYLIFRCVLSVKIGRIFRLY